MHQNKLFIQLLLTILLSLYSNAQAQTNESQNEVSLQNAVLSHINHYRKQHGLSALQMNEQMVKEARQHSIDMAKHKIPFGHQYFITRINRLHTRIKNSGAGAENVAYNYKNAQDVVKNWLKSPGHKRNIDGNYDTTGVGVAYDNEGKIYFTQIFLNTKTTSRKSKKLFTHAFNHSLFK